MSRRQNSGFIVEYTRDDGTLQKAIARHSEQAPEIKHSGRALLRLIDDDYKPIVEEGGKEKIVLKGLKSVRVIGMVD